MAGLCKIKCPGNEYFDQATNTCLPASSICATASHSSTHCTSYNEGTPVFAGGPVAGQFATCAAGTFWDGTQCSSCHSSCLSCSGATSSHCTSCKFGLEPSAGACLYPTCATNCLACIGTVTCVVPAPGFYITHSNIVSRYKPCKGATFFDSATLTCLPCHASCSSCHGPQWGECIHCKEDHFRYGTLCVTNPSNCQIYKQQGVSMISPGTCVDCTTIHPKCLQCVDFKCLYCDYGFFATTAGQCSPCSSKTRYCQQFSGLSLACFNGFTHGRSNNCTRNCASGQL